LSSSKSRAAAISPTSILNFSLLLAAGARRKVAGIAAQVLDRDVLKPNYPRFDAVVDVNRMARLNTPTYEKDQPGSTSLCFENSGRAADENAITVYHNDIGAKQLHPATTHEPPCDRVVENNYTLRLFEAQKIDSCQDGCSRALDRL
jgi:hypothetical protein